MASKEQVSPEAAKFSDRKIKHLGKSLETRQSKGLVLSFSDPDADLRHLPAYLEWSDYARKFLRSIRWFRNSYNPGFR